MKTTMSRLAKYPIVIPSNVEVNIDGNVITVKGPKGELKREINDLVQCKIEDNKIHITPNTSIMKRKSDAKTLRIFTGTYYSHIKNMLKGVTEGFSKELEVVGIGYRAQLRGKKLVLNLGYSHPIEIDIPDDVQIEVPEPNRIIVKGIDKEKIGQFAANIRAWRKPNVYSGKGIRYKGEVIRTKVGKKV